MPDDITNPTTPDPKSNPDISEALAAFEAKFEEKLQSAITGVAGRLGKQADKKYETQIAELKAQLAELAAPKEDPEPTPEPVKDPAPDPQTLAMQKQIEDLQKLVTQSQQEAAKEKIRATRSTTESDLITKLQDKVVNPRQLLMVAEASGAIVYEDGQFVRSVKDQWDNVTKVAITEGDYLDTLLASSDYSHFAKARPGAGTGAAGSKQTPTQNKSTLFSESSTATSEQVTQMAKEKGFGALIADLEATAKQ
jgi:metal-dependent amidase/aminoacylase/carboxypeptidase family protein